MPNLPVNKAAFIEYWFQPPEGEGTQPYPFEKLAEKKGIKESKREILSGNETEKKQIYDTDSDLKTINWNTWLEWLLFDLNKRQKV